MLFGGYVFERFYDTFLDLLLCGEKALVETGFLVMRSGGCPCRVTRVTPSQKLPVGICGV